MNLNENRIRDLAYQIWESEGRPHGQAARHWDIACKLTAETAASASDQQQSGSMPKTRKGSLAGAGAAIQQQAEGKPAAKPARKSKPKTTPQMS